MTDFRLVRVLSHIKSSSLSFEQEAENHAAKIEALQSFRTTVQIEKQAALLDAADAFLWKQSYTMVSLVRNWLDDCMLSTGKQYAHEVPYVYIYALKSSEEL